LILSESAPLNLAHSLYC